MAEEKQTRPSWDQYFLNIMREVGKRSTCDRGKVGAVMTKENRIVATGYAGSPKGMPHCDEVGHLMKKSFDENGNIKENCVRTTHAEQNAITQAALELIVLGDETMQYPQKS